MKLVITERALADLAEIGRYIKRDNPRRSATFVKELLERCKRISLNPYLSPLLPRHENKEIRRRPHGNYLIFYRVHADEVIVLHILHGARDYESLLFPD